MASTFLAPAPPSAEQAFSVGVFAERADLQARIFSALAESGFAASYVCSDLAEAKEGHARHGVDLFIVGARRAKKTSLEIVSSLVLTFPELCIVMVCERSAAGDIRKGLAAGARGFVLFDDIDRALAPVLRVVLAGQVSVPGLRGGEIGRPILTNREKQVLRLVVTGMTNGEIASRLYLAESTVKSHLSSSFAKLGVASRSEAASLILDPVRGRGLGIPAMDTGKA